MSTRPVAPPFPIVAWLSNRTPLQRRLAWVVGVLAAIAVTAPVVARIVMDRWWLDSVTTSDVWTTTFGAQLILVVTTAALSASVLITSAVVAYRTEPAVGNGPNRVVVRYRQRMGPAHKWVLIGGAIYLTARFAWAAMDEWQPLLLFLNGPSLQVKAPAIGWDLGFHLFRLPFLALATTWLRTLMLVALGFAIYGHVANGALKIPRDGRKSAPRSLKHLALLAGAFATIQAFDYIFVEWPGNATNQFGAFDGPGFTELRFVVPSLWLLAAVAMVSATFAFNSARTGKWKATLVAFGSWGVLQLVVGIMLPGLINQLLVAPAEAERQLPYIAHNLEATKSAYSLHAVEQVESTFADGLPGALDPIQAQELSSVPLFSESQLIAPLQVLQGTTGTRITDVDLDRYVIDGVRRPVLVAARNSNRADLPERGWVQEHLVYTHGEGVVAVPADSTSSDGRPDVDALAEHIAPVKPELYFGENLTDWYVLVGTKRIELGGSEFDGGTGIAMSSPLRRLVLALTVGEIEPLVSTELDANTTLLFHRDVRERLDHIAPFLSFDANPYPVVADGKITWVVDGYTSADTYPYSQYARAVGLPPKSDLYATDFNYLHASVKATIDAYDGTVHLYRTALGGADDPILDAWSLIFPNLIEPIDNMPAGIREHLLYPSDMLSVQTAILGRYHVTDAETLFNGSDSWAISAAAGSGVARTSSSDVATSVTPATDVSLFMPGSGSLGGHWVAIRPYGPGSSQNPTSTRDELAAFAIADHDDPEHLVLVRINVDSGRLISSPKVAQAAIDTDGDLAALFTLLNANGSAVQFGPMTLIPLDNAIVWARSVIVTGTAETTAPRLYGVAAVSNGLVGQADTVARALDLAVAAETAG